MITFLLNVIKFTIAGVFATIIITMGFIVVGVFIDYVSCKLNDYINRKKE